LPAKPGACSGLVLSYRRRALPLEDRPDEDELRETLDPEDDRDEEDEELREDELELREGAL
jgi:hypothetical protein